MGVRESGNGKRERRKEEELGGVASLDSLERPLGFAPAFTHERRETGSGKRARWNANQSRRRPTRATYRRLIGLANTRRAWKDEPRGWELDEKVAQDFEDDADERERRANYAAPGESEVQRGSARGEDSLCRPGL